MRARRGLWSLMVTLLVASSAHAQTADDKAAAEALFREGQVLFDAGRVAEACPKFEASYQLDTGLGTLLNLARCYEKEGKLASAWARYVDLESLATRLAQNDRATIARDAITRLEPRLTRIRIMPIAVEGAPDATITRDGVLVQPAAYGVALVLDPGMHHIEATAIGYQPWSRDVELTKEGHVVDVMIPALQALASPQPAPVPVADPEPVVPLPDSEPDPEPTVPLPMPEPVATGASNTSFYVVGGILLGVGGVALGIGAGFATSAGSSWADAACQNGRCPTPEAQTLSESAKREADVATGMVVGGSVFAAAGAVFLITAIAGGAPSEQRAGWSVTSDGAILRF